MHSAKSHQAQSLNTLIPPYGTSCRSHSSYHCFTHPAGGATKWWENEKEGERWNTGIGNKLGVGWLREADDEESASS